MLRRQLKGWVGTAFLDASGVPGTMRGCLASSVNCSLEVVESRKSSEQGSGLSFRESSAPKRMAGYTGGTPAVQSLLPSIKAGGMQSFPFKFLNVGVRAQHSYQSSSPKCLSTLTNIVMEPQSHYPNLTPWAERLKLSQVFGFLPLPPLPEMNPVLTIASLSGALSTVHTNKPRCLEVGARGTI